MKQNDHNKLLFSVSNHHTDSCGQPPTIDGDKPNTYHGYFENTYGEQFIFAFNIETKKAELWCGDAGWEQPFPVVKGLAKGLILSTEEQIWLQACWRAVTWRMK